MSFLKDYEPVEDRLRAFWEQHPQGRVVTELLHHADGAYIVLARVYRGDELRDNPPAATGLARDAVSELSAELKKSALEVCETSAIGRALANLGYAPKGKRPSREEMQKASAKLEPPATESLTSTDSEPTQDRGMGEAEDVAGGKGATAYGEGAESPPPASPKPSDKQRWMEEFHPGKAHKMEVAPNDKRWEICTTPTLGSAPCPWAVFHGKGDA